MDRVITIAPRTIEEVGGTGVILIVILILTIVGIAVIGKMEDTTDVALMKTQTVTTTAVADRTLTGIISTAESNTSK